MVFDENESLHSKEGEMLIETIKNLNQQFTSMSIEKILIGSQRLNHFRKISSGTLKKEGQEFWELANNYVSERVALGLLPEWKDILKLNQLFNPTHEAKIRQGQIWIGNHEACPPEDLTEKLIQFQNKILPNLNSDQPLIWAARVRFWLVTLHPFSDGNGRTSNLLCDWLLALNGYLPISHSLKSDSHIGGWVSRSHFSNFELACFKTLSAVIHSYEIVLQNNETR
jgi:Fic family protein